MFKNTRSPVLGALRGLAFAAATALATAAWAASTPMPAQVPLISRVASPPPPTVMITIDDSGSMQANFMPEVGTKVNGFAVTMPTLSSMADMIDIWYGDKQTRTYSGFQIPRGITYAIPGGLNRFQRQMRSAAVNSIFYDPTVLYLPWLKPDGVTRMPNAVYTAAYWDPVNTGLGSTDLSQKPNVNTGWCGDAVPSHCTGSSSNTYDPALYYVIKTTSSDPNDPASYTEYDLNDGNASKIYPFATVSRVCSGGGGCCAATGCTLTQERQNFANWFVYYRTRTLLMKGAMSESLSGVVGTSAADMKLRVGFGTINSGSQSIDGKSTSVVRLGVRDLDHTQLTNVLTGIQAINPYGSTPLRQATVTVGDYFRRDASSDSGSPWRTLPGTSSDGKTPVDCRRAYELLTTDGYYNDSPANAGSGIAGLTGYGGNIDGNDGPSYGTAGVVSPGNELGLSPNHYTHGTPYSDSSSNMLADYGMAHYVADLQPNMANKVRTNPSTGDIAYWQHLTMMTVGLGVQGTLTPDPNNPGVPILPPGGWGTDKIDDLWHAAVDTHGTFFSARNVVTLTEGLSSALGKATADPRSEGGAAVSGTTLQTTTVKYTPSYAAAAWTGHLNAYKLDPVSGLQTSLLWDAATVMPAAASRNLYTWTGASQQSVKFDTSMSSTLKDLVAPAATQNSLIDYIRGDRSNEGVGKPYRRRDGVLGDLIDSTPLLVQGLVDLGYDNLPGAPGYRGYVTAKQARTSGVIFDGGNDGMLHGFRTTDGVEVYGYVPKVELPNLSILAAQDYGSSTNFHRDFVDGPQVETDAYIQTRRVGSKAWSDIVIGSFGGGAPGAYALDVTSLSAFDDRTLLWELAGGAGGDPDVGYIMSKIAVGVLPSSNVGSLTPGQWLAFVGNGVDSVNGRAVMLLVDLYSGNIVSRIVLPSSGANGLMGVKLVYNANQEVVAAYAGDLQGNLWRVDFTGGSAPTVGFGNKPLFRAVDATGTPQPIVEAPAVYPRSLGNMVLFGTGKLIDATDADSATPQSFYGVWDNTPAGAVSTASSPFEASIASGTERQMIVEQTISPLTGGYYQVSSNPVDFATKFGWVMDLTPVNPKQRVIYSPLIVGQFVLINTMAPGATPVPQSCDQPRGSSAYFLLPAETGAAYQAAPVWDVDGDGVVGDAGDSMSSNGQTVQAAGYSIDSSGGDTNIISVGGGTYQNITSGDQSGGGSGGGTGNPDKRFMPPPCIANCKIQKRVWQQLLTPPF
jgi:type IV pilus assembly protein PilY1